MPAQRSIYGPILWLLPLIVGVGCLMRTNHSDPADLPAALDPETRRARVQELLRNGPMHGVALGLFSQDPAYDYRELLGEIRDLNCEWVSLCVNHYQKHNDSVEIGIPDSRTSPEARVRATIAEAKRQGFRVLLFPILLLSEPGEDDWRGTIQPSDRERWYQEYGQLLNHYASMAEDYDVDLLSVGSEFNSMEGDREPWLKLIREVRSRFRGALTYSVNWDSVSGPAFYDQLDVVGMTTYSSLTVVDDPTVAQLRDAWQPIREDILTWQAHLGLPLIFTEVGYASQNGINKDPWNYFISTDVDLQEQVDCYQAFTDTWLGCPQLSGVFFYNWFGQGGSEDLGYTPRGKPALQVMKRWFEEDSGAAMQKRPSTKPDKRDR